MAIVITWPSANEYMEAIQNPRIAFSDAVLRDGVPAITRLGMPHVASGNFAYVFKLKLNSGARAIKCFRQFLGDRERRYVAIDKHLDTQPLQVFAQFEYDAEGILIAGRRYPVLVMEWLEGPTLDVYVDAALDQGRGREALTTLAAEWARVVKQLDDGGVAHGDLQHGNAIVTTTGLRLVDLDGMYVPALSGTKAGELGHPHFQHPRRTEEYFNATLDRFAALVIYTSLLALVERPELWSRYHDDNLIFKKDDYKDPKSSALFRELRRTGSSELNRLTDTLAQAAVSDPSATPRLADLVQIQQITPSKLPSWMRSPTMVTVKTASREADGTSPSPRPPTIGNQASPARQPTSTVAPIPTTSTPTQSTRASHPGAASEWFKAGCRLGFQYSFVGLFGIFLWAPALSGIVNGLFNVSRKDDGHYLLVILLYVATCMAFGLWRQHIKNSPQQPVRRSQPAPTPTLTYRPTPPPVHTTGSSSGSPVVASSIRNIYHRPSCSWAGKISRRNQISYSSAAAATSAGHRACRVCHP
jgi:metal binding Ada-like protein